MTEPDKPTPSLYGWAGGEPAIRRLMDCFYDRVERDDLLAPRFFPDGVNEAHRAHVSAWWSEVLGGPARYTEELGGYEGMLAHHRGLAVISAPGDELRQHPAVRVGGHFRAPPIRPRMNWRLKAK